jgi:hydrogenase expression/formation protein HypE
LRHEKLPTGKLPVEILAPMLKSMPSGNLVVAPEIGIDVGVTRSKGKYIVSSSDPITGAVERIGWHAVNVSANDVATSGIMPDTLNVIALFPEGTSSNGIETVLNEINESAEALGISVAGGHTEITPSLKRPIIAVTAFGSGDSFVTAADAQMGDSILMTKTAGIEGTSILSSLPPSEKQVNTDTLRRGRDLLKKLSILKEAKTAFNTGKVHAMHDLTEGGVVGCTLEMSLASKLGFELYEDQVPVDEATREVCSKLKVDPLKLIGSGSLLIACAASDSVIIKDRLGAENIPCAEIGRFQDLTKGRWIVSKGKREELTGVSVQDEIWPALSEYGNLP